MTDEQPAPPASHENEPPRAGAVRGAGWGLLALFEGIARHLLVEVALFASVIMVVMCLVAAGVGMKVAGVALGICTLIAIMLALRKKLTVRQQWLMAGLLLVVDGAVLAIGWKLGVWPTPSR